jgi:cobalamin biosynthesis Co2+ chelatase CbiK
MLSTDFKEFKKLFDRIPKERLDNVRFIPLMLCIGLNLLLVAFSPT